MLVPIKKYRLEWITSDDRLEDFGEKLREEFCKWLTSK